MQDVRESIGLRELKRRATESAIETAAVRIALDEGIDAVTVERICAEALVSRSTFFNYFPTRDAAIFGKSIELEPGERLDEILRQWATALPVGLAVAVFESIGTHRMNSDVARMRMELVQKHPEVTDRIAAELFGYRRRLEGIVEDWFVRHPQHSVLGDPQRDAVTVVGLAVVLAEELYAMAMSGEGDIDVDLTQLLDAYSRVRSWFAAYAGDASA